MHHVQLINSFLTVHNSSPNLMKDLLVTWLQQSRMYYILI